MELTFDQRQQITVLKNKDKKENRDFRVVWFNNQAEIKIIEKSEKEPQREVQNCDLEAV